MQSFQNSDRRICTVQAQISAPRHRVPTSRPCYALGSAPQTHPTHHLRRHSAANLSRLNASVCAVATSSIRGLVMMQATRLQPKLCIGRPRKQVVVRAGGNGASPVCELKEGGRVKVKEAVTVW